MNIAGAALCSLLVGVGVGGSKVPLERVLARYTAPGGECIPVDSLRSYLANDDAVIRHLRSKGDLAPDALRRISEARLRVIVEATRVPSDPEVAGCESLNLYRVEEVITRLNGVGAGMSEWPVLYLPSDDLPSAEQWPVSIQREVSDDLSPGKAQKAAFPATISYVRNEHASGNKDQYNIVGALQVGPAVFSLGSTRRDELGIGFGVDADIPGGAEVPKTSLVFQAPVSILINGLERGWVNLALTPKLTTDRAAVRDVRELAASATPGGVLSWGRVHGDRWTLYWSPTLRGEFGKVENAAGNSALAAIQAKGSYSRLATVWTARFGAPIIGTKCHLSNVLQLRHDLGQGWTRSFNEIMFSIDLDPKGRSSFVITERTGKKPPSFEQVDQTLVGFGLHLGADE